MSDRKIDEIRRVPIFSRCSKSEIQALARNTEEVDLPPGKTLIHQGKSNDTFFVLVEGEVEVRVGDREPRRLGPGSVLGEMSMLDRGPATATVSTVTPVTVLVMSHPQFLSAVKAHENIAIRVIEVMAERLRHDQRGES